MSIKTLLLDKKGGISVEVNGFINCPNSKRISMIAQIKQTIKQFLLFCNGKKANVNREKEHP